MVFSGALKDIWIRVKEISDFVVLKAVENFRGENNMFKNIGFLAAACVLTIGTGFAVSKYLGSENGGMATVYAETARPGQSKMYGGGNSGYARGLTAIAEKLGMSVEDLRAQLGEKTMMEIAEEKGYSVEEFQQIMSDMSLQRWQERGLSDEIIAERQAAQAERRANCTGDGSYNGTFRGSPFNK